MPVSLPSCSWITLKTDYIQNIILNNVKLEHTSIKLLGLHIKTDLAWKKHITSVAKSLSSKIGFFLRLSKFLNLILSANYILHLSPLIWTTVLLYGVIVPPHILIAFKSFETVWQGSLQKNYNYQIHGLDIVKQRGRMLKNVISTL